MGLAEIDRFAIPELRDELNRKAIEAIETLMLDKESGKISYPQFVTGVKTLFNTVAGLVSEDIIDILSAVRDKHGDEPNRVTRLFRRGERVTAVSMTVGEDHFLVRDNIQDSLKQKIAMKLFERDGLVGDRSPSARAKAAFLEVCLRLLKSGAIEL